MTENLVRRESLPADARSVREARTVVRAVISESGHVDRDEWADRAALAVSELVTNAVVHAGTTIELRVHLSQRSLRVEIADESTQAPSARSHAVTAVTGRGLHLVDSSVDRWDIETHPDGKIVWFEIGEPLGLDSRQDDGDDLPDTDVRVVLQKVPLLIHMAWQEQISALLREYLLFRLEEDPGVLERHARASAVMGLLFEQLPAPVLQDRPEAIMVDAAGPKITAAEVVLRVPRALLPDFDVLADLIEEAVVVARSGELLANPTQPEVTAMRRWLCEEVRRQADDPASEPRPFTLETDLSPAPEPMNPALRALADTDDPVVVADEDFRIAAVTPAMLRLLDHDDESALLGRRVLAVVPMRYHQAKIAGTALHLTNGRSALLDVPIQVPVVRRDGTELVLGLTVEPHVLDGGLRAYAARFSELSEMTDLS